MLDRDTGKAGFIEITDKKVPEPLFLPKGSIRAMVTIAMAVSCWILIFTGKVVPGYLLSLLLAIIGYYFGFRKKMKAAESRILDASAEEEEPLSLPHGFIRSFIAIGFLVSGIVLCFLVKSKELKYLEFFLILFGLILGYFFARMFSGFEGGPLHILINHLKAVLVLGATAYLAYLLLTGTHGQLKYASLVLSCVITFYFGSRS